MSRAAIYFEVVGVDVQLFGVQLAQLLVFLLDVVHVLQGPVHTVQHRHTVFGDVGVVLDGICIVEVTEAGKVSLRPGVNDQTPAGEKDVRVSHAQERGRVSPPRLSFFSPDQSLGADVVIVQVGEEVVDDGALLISPLNHGDTCLASDLQEKD